MEDCINPLIRGSIVGNLKDVIWHNGINPPIRGSIEVIAYLTKLFAELENSINPPIRGSIAMIPKCKYAEVGRLNPPIRGSIVG